MLSVPRKSRLKLPPLELGDETPGQRIARLRREHGWTQTELAERIGIVQGLVSDYELDKLRLNAEMLARFARTLGVSADELLGLDQAPANGGKTVSLKVARRMRKVEQLPPRQQAALLKTIDAFLKAAEIE